MIIIVLWIALGCVAGLLASKKGRSFWGFFCLAFFLSPLIGIIGASVAKAKKKCPACAEFILTEARICKFCGSTNC